MWMVAAAAAVALVAVGGGLFFALRDGTFHATGTFTLTGGAYQDGNTCYGSGGYDDIANGVAVTMYGASGDVVGVGQLRGGTYRDMSCVFRVDIPEVRSGESFYQIEVSHRGRISVSEEDAENGRIALTLGEYS